jgi:hypothetical protein
MNQPGRMPFSPVCGSAMSTAVAASAPREQTTTLGRKAPNPVQPRRPGAPGGQVPLTGPAPSVVSARHRA